MARPCASSSEVMGQRPRILQLYPRRTTSPGRRSSCRSAGLPARHDAWPRRRAVGRRARRHPYGLPMARGGPARGWPGAMIRAHRIQVATPQGRPHLPSWPGLAAPVLVLNRGAASVAAAARLHERVRDVACASRSSAAWSRGSRRKIEVIYSGTDSTASIPVTARIRRSSSAEHFDHPDRRAPGAPRRLDAMALPPPAPALRRRARRARRADGRGWARPPRGRPRSSATTSSSTPPTRPASPARSARPRLEPRRRHRSGIPSS